MPKNKLENCRPICTLCVVAGLDFDAVVKTYYGTLYRFALSLSRNDTEARDLTQQTFYIWATKGQQLRDESKLKPWLLRTLHREFLGARRHEVRFPHVEFSSVAHELPKIPPPVGEEMDGETVMQALMQVEEIHRAPLTLFYLEDFSYKQIAEALDIPAGTVMSRLARGKAQLRQLIAIEAERREDKMVSLKAGVGEGEMGHG